MTRAAVFVASVGVLCLIVSVDARAEPIRITGGSLEFDNTLGGGHSQGGRLSIVGNRGFSATGIADSLEAPIGPINHCHPCQPASTIPLDAIFGATTVTLDGQTYPDVRGASPEIIDFALSGTIDLPPWRDAAVTASAPFEATGAFQRSFPPLPFSSRYEGAAGRRSV
jgi:hypothetical protein